jgi:glutamate synthase (NADPH) small chain
MTKSFAGSDGHVTQLQAVRVEFEGRNLKEVPGSEFTLDADLVLLAMGFLGPERKGMLLGVAINERGNVTTDAEKMTSVPGMLPATWRAGSRWLCGRSAKAAWQRNPSTSI